MISNIKKYVLVLMIIWTAFSVVNSYALSDVISDTPPHVGSIYKLTSAGLSPDQQRKYSGLNTGGVGGRGMGLYLAAKMRANAAYRLAERGEDVKVSEPLLVGLLDDNYTIWVYQPEKNLPLYLNGDIKTTQGEVAAKALDKINPDWRNSKFTKETENELLFFLKYGSVDDKEKAAYALGWIKSKRAVKPLCDLINSPENSLAISAMAALGEVGDRRAFMPLLISLNTWEQAKSEAASKALGKLYPDWRESDAARAQADALLDLLGNKNDGFLSAANALGELGDRRAVEGLINALNDDTGFSAIDALGKIKDENAVKPLIKIYNKLPHTKLRVIQALAEIRSSADSDLMISALEDYDINVRLAAAKVLAQRKDERVVNCLIELLKEDWPVRKLAVEALGDVGDRRAVEPLIAVMKKERMFLTDNSPIFGYEDHPATITQWLAVDALRKIGAPSVKPLISLLADDRPEVREIAAKTLSYIGDDDAKADILKFIKEFDFENDEKRIMSSIKPIFEMSNPQIIQVLIDLLKKPGVDIYAENALAGAGEAAIKPLIAIINGDDDTAAYRAIGALRKINFESIRSSEQKNLRMQISDAVIDFCQSHSFTTFGMYSISENALRIISSIGMDNPRAADLIYEALATDMYMELWWLGNLELKDPKFVDPLIKRIYKGNDGFANANALTALSKIDDPRVIETIISLALTPADQRKSGAAIQALARIGSPLALDALMRIVKDNKSSGRVGTMVRDLVPILENSDDPKAFEIILELLDYDNFAVKSTAISALGRAGNKRTIEQLINVLKKTKQGKNDDILRGAISYTLSRIGAPSIKPLISLIKESDGDLRLSAEKALMRTRDANAVEPLVDALKENDDVQVLNVICWALIKLGEPAEDPLLALLETGDTKKKELAAFILKNIGYEPLTKSEDKTNQVVPSNQNVKGKITKSIDIQSAYSGTIQKIAELSKTGEPAIKELIALLDNKNINMRKEARKALAGFGTVAVEPLIDALSDSSMQTRQNAAWALGTIKDNRAVEPLLSKLKSDDPDPICQSYLIFALGSIGDARAAKPLILIANDKNSSVRKYAVRALGNIKDILSVESMINILNDTDPDISKEAKKALVKLTGQDFGTDQAKWRKWWEDYKDKF